MNSLFVDSPDRPAPRWVRFGSFAILALALAGACFGTLVAILDQPDVIWRYRQVFWRGWLLTIGVSAVALIVSTSLGLLLAHAQRSRIVLLRSAATLYVEVVRGSPLLVLILFGFYVVFPEINLTNRFVSGVLILSAFSAAYIAEMIRAGIESVGSSQIDSARAIGLTPRQTFRFVIFPQALRQTLPPLAGQFASLIKDSSLLSIIGLAEFTYSAGQINSATYSTLAAYSPLLIGYLLLTIPISLIARWLEHRFRYDT
ncbi:MAG: amino acid ABC transporter permease [Chthoniobacterales bacterium]